MSDKKQAEKTNNSDKSLSQASQSTKSNRNKTLLIALLILAVGTAVAGLIFFFTVRQNPGNTVMNAVLKAVEADSLRGKGTIETKLDRFNGQLNIEFSSVKAEQNSSMDAKIAYQSDNVKKPVKTDGQVILGSDGTVYLKMDNVKGIVAAAFQEIDAVQQQIQAKRANPQPFTPGKLIVNASEFLNDKWIKLPPGQASGDSSLNPLACAQGVVAKYNTNSSERRAITKAYKSNDFFEVDSKVLKDKDGSDGYRVSIDQDKFKNFEQAVKKTTVGKMMADCASQSSDSSSNQDEILDGHIDLWISKYSQEITHLQIDNQTTKLDASLDYSGGTEVKLPGEAKTITEIFTKSNLEAEAKNS